MAKITVTGYVVSSDPGIRNISSYEGSVDVADIQPEQNIKYIVKDEWWCNVVAGKFSPLYFIELRDEGALLKYGENEVLVKYGEEKRLEEVGLSYAYGELFVKVEK